MNQHANASPSLESYDDVVSRVIKDLVLAFFFGFLSCSQKTDCMVNLNKFLATELVMELKVCQSLVYMHNALSSSFLIIGIQVRENTNDGANGGQVRSSFICLIVSTINYVIIKSFSLELLLYVLSYLSNQLMLIFFVHRIPLAMKLQLCCLSTNLDFCNSVKTSWTKSHILWKSIPAETQDSFLFINQFHQGCQ